jgi:prepilin-type N-terminal cleavage/methylation domain-containing protein
MKKLVRRSGFTLPEILVTVTVIAVLAAVVVPTVLQYASKGDAPSVATEIDALKKGIIGFTADTRHYPRSLYQLSTKIDTVTGTTDSTASDLSSAKYSDADVALWKGPYYDQTISGTEYTTKALGIKFGTTLVKCGANSAFLCLSIANTFTKAEIAALDQKIDAGNGVTATATSDANAANGNLIWSVTAVTFQPTSIRYKLAVAN